MNIYISSHDKTLAHRLCIEIQESRFDDHEVVSTWHEGPKIGTTKLSRGDKEDIAERNTKQIRSADVLFLIASPGYVPGGKFVEAGYALGRGIDVVIIGNRENVLLYHPDVLQYDSNKEVIDQYLASN